VVAVVLHVKGASHAQQTDQATEAQHDVKARAFQPVIEFGLHDGQIP
jgi:hypothetical protein